MDDIEPRLVSVKGAAKALDTTPWTVYKLLDAGAIESVYMGSRRKVVIKSLDEYVNSLSSTPDAVA